MTRAACRGQASMASNSENPAQQWKIPVCRASDISWFECDRDDHAMPSGAPPTRGAGMQ